MSRPPIRVLLVEDNANDAEMILHELGRAGFEPIWDRVQTEPDFLGKLNNDLDIILSDFAMPQFSGQRALELLKDTELSIPFIIISGAIGEEEAVQVMKMGAADYLLKDRLARLGSAVKQAMEQGRSQRERRKIKEELSHTHHQFQRLLEHSPAVIYSLKVESDRVTTLLVSENITNLLGFEVAEVAEAEWWAGQVHPDDRELAFTNVARTLESGFTTSEYRIRHKQGVYLWVQDTQRLVSDAPSNSVEIAGAWLDITARKQTGLIVQRQQTELRVLFDLMPAMIWFKDTNNCIVHANKRVAEAAGKPLEQIEGFSTHDVYPGEAARFYEDDLQVIRSKAPKLGLIEKILGPNGEELWNKTDKVPYFDSAGNVIGIVVMAQDVTEQKRAATALLESKHFLQATLDALSSHIAILDENGVIIAVNAAWKHFAAENGFTSSQLGVGDDYLHVCDGARGENAQEAAPVALGLRELMAGQRQEFHLEYPCHAGDLHRWFILRATRFSGDGPVRVVVAHDNITTRKLAEESVRESEERFVGAFEHAPIGVALVAPSGRWLKVNHALCEIVGYSEERLLSFSFQDITHPDDLEADLAQIRRMKEGEIRAYQIEKRYIHASGSFINVLLNVSMVRERDGQPRYFIAQIEDVTERKQLEQQFLRAQRMESIGTLAGGIAHDLNNVLAPIMMSIDLLKMQERDPLRLRVLATIAGSAKRGADMVQQVLSFARGVEGQRVEVGVGKLLKEIEKIINDTFLKNVQVVCNIPADLWTVQGDPTQLHQVLLNLCVNARDAMPQGGMLTLSARNMPASEPGVGTVHQAKLGPHILIEVRDTGTGMPKEVVERIFEPFFTTKEVGKGTGLGLSTTIAIVKSHGGCVEVQSDVGIGTCFSVCLPAIPLASALKVAEANDELPFGDGETILVVDDEAAVREIIQHTLEGFGYHVILASNGADATAIYAQQGPKVAAVLTDMIMPIMDGATTIQVLMRINPQIKIIAASGLNADGMASRAANAGVKHFLPKPYAAEALLKVLHLLLHS